MIVIASTLFGVLLGWLTARRRGGNRLDIAQYAAVFAMVFGMLGLIVTIILARVIA